MYVNPNDLWVKEYEQLIGTMITAATFQTLEGKKVPTIEENVAEIIKYHEYDNGLLIKEYVIGQTVFYEVVSKVVGFLFFYPFLCEEGFYIQCVESK